MARGWESKSVEAQQAEVVEESKKAHARRLSPEEAARTREKENLELARRGVLRQIEAAVDERYRKMLEQSLAALDEKLAKLEQTA